MLNRYCTSNEVVFLVQAFPLHLCNLSLIVGDYPYQCFIQVALLICQEFVLLQAQKDLKRGRVWLLFQNQLSHKNTKSLKAC